MSTNNYPVCILTAGEGTRLLPLTKSINKSLIPIQGVPIISKILENINPKHRIVIALGHKGDIVKDFLLTFYPEYQFEFVQVQGYNAPNSGPGPSLYACKNYLNSPFYFVACDTLWEKPLKDFPQDINWLGTSDKYNDNKEIFCNVETNHENIISKFHNKIAPKCETSAFVGLSFIKDHELFWKDLGNSLERNLIDVYHGFDSILKNQTLKKENVEWHDVGNFENIEKFTLNKYNFSKPDEFIWFLKDKVIKYFRNKKTLDTKYQRAHDLKGIIPDNVKSSNHFLYYDLAPGNTYYKSFTEESFPQFFNFIQDKLWRDVSFNEVELENCLKSFYLNKTRDRISLFKEKYGNWYPKLINGKNYYSFEDKILNAVKSQMINHAKPVVFHGDLQFDNVLFEKDQFTLIDWRESFGGQSHWGDQYYDLAKMYGGLIINYSLIKDHRFSYIENGNDISISLEEEDWQSEARNTFENMIKENSFEMKYIKLLTSLIFLNMSPLHHYPFDKFLYSISFLTFLEYDSDL